MLARRFTYQPDNLVSGHRLERRQYGRRAITNIRRTSCRCCGADRVDFVGEVLCEVRLGVSELRRSRLFYEFVKFRPKLPCVAIALCNPFPPVVCRFLVKETSLDGKLVLPGGE